jgi:hypothetical protein
MLKSYPVACDPLPARAVTYSLTGLRKGNRWRITRDHGKKAAVGLAGAFFAACFPVTMTWMGPSWLTAPERLQKESCHDR